jgi:hypothetical protein
LIGGSRSGKPRREDHGTAPLETEARFFVSCIDVASVRAMVARNLRPFYAAQAKERQVASGGDVRNKTVPEKVREAKINRKNPTPATKQARPMGVHCSRC